MKTSEVDGRPHPQRLLADNLRNARLRLHMSRRRQRQEQPLLEDQETSSPGQREVNEPSDWR